MKLASFRHRGRSSFGVVLGDRVVDCGLRLGARFPTLRAALAGGALDRIARMASEPADLALADIAFDIPIPDAQKIIAIGMNYAAHIAEMGQEMPKFPNLFARFANSLVGHGQAIERPRASEKLDWEGELAVVIGKAGRHIAAGSALAHVAGYTCFNEGSIRDWQTRAAQNLAGKNFFASGSCGPWIVTAEEIGDPGRLGLRSRVNGVEMQNATTADLVFPIPALIAYVSSFTRLEPGDILVTGNPSGSGFMRKPPIWLQPGDVLEVEIDGIGTLRNGIVAEPAQ
ncbi:MAG: fumarylacetoacetate hydrolase family protein [Alphaproteobacteria bacterium]|nr:fumarylacetoacetate hydrolase family protein [Alphaproteobacteria bacterium]